MRLAGSKEEKKGEGRKCVQCGRHSCVFEACMFSCSYLCELERREEGGGEVQAIFHKTLKPILMRNLPLGVSMLQLKKKKKHLKNAAVDPLRGNLEREGG